MRSVALALAGCVRQEYLLTLGVAFLGVGALAFREGWRPWRWLAKSSSRAARSTSLAGAILLSMILGFVAVRTTFLGADHRAWFAFQQHYALRAAESGRDEGINPWIDYRVIVKREFPTSVSIFEAARENPKAFLSHIAANFKHVVPELIGLLRPHPGCGWAVWLLPLAATLALLGKRPTSVAVRQSRVTGWLLVAAGLATGPGLLIYSKGSYLLPILPLALVALGMAIQRWGPKLSDPWHWGVNTVIPTGIVLLIAVTPGPLKNDHRPRLVAETVSMLQSRLPQGPPNTLFGVGTTSYAAYLGADRCIGLEAFAEVAGRSPGNQKAEDAILTLRPTAVLVTDEWKKSLHYNEELLHSALMREFREPVSTPVGELYLRR